jgi:hypothetical protein
LPTRDETNERIRPGSIPPRKKFAAEDVICRR